MLLRRSVLFLSLALATTGWAHAQAASGNNPPVASASSAVVPPPVALPPAPITRNFVLDAELASRAHNVPSYDWYLAPRLGAIVPDGNRRTNASVLEGLGVGRWFGPNVSLDLESTLNNANFHRSSGRGGKQWEDLGLGVTGHAYTGVPEDATRFYVLGGIGAMRDAAVSDQVHDAGWSPTATVGLGLQHAFNDRVALRTELALRYDHDNVSSKYVLGIPDSDHYNDAVASVGLVIGLGKNTPYVVYHQDLDSQPAQPGCETLDTDHDGVNDCQDRCPNTPAGAYVGPDGCPIKVVIDLRGVNFKFDRPRAGETDIRQALAEPTDASVAVLDQAVDLLTRDPQLKVEVVGFTDSVGTDAYNQPLSDRRAHAVASYLTSHGVNEGRIRNVLGQGKSQPIGSNDTAEGRAANRRVELHPKAVLQPPVLPPAPYDP